MRYVVYCWEYGNTPDDPYTSDNNIEDAIYICNIMASSTEMRWYVNDMFKGFLTAPENLRETMQS